MLLDIICLSADVTLSSLVTMLTVYPSPVSSLSWPSTQELDLSRPGAESGLKVCCWINTLERQLYTRPFEGGDEFKWPYFLQENHFASFLHALRASPDADRSIWGTEYDRVKEDLDLLASRGQVRRYDDIGSPPFLFSVF